MLYFTSKIPINNRKIVFFRSNCNFDFLEILKNKENYNKNNILYKIFWIIIELALT